MGVERNPINQTDQLFDQGHKSPAQRGNFQNRPTGVERNPINQTGQLVSFRKITKQ